MTLPAWAEAPADDCVLVDHSGVDVVWRRADGGYVTQTGTGVYHEMYRGWRPTPLAPLTGDETYATPDADGHPRIVLVDSTLVPIRTVMLVCLALIVLAATLGLVILHLVTS